MSTRKSTFFYGVLVGFVCLVVGMVIASRLDLTPGSFGNALDIPVTNSAPLEGAIDATTFRTIAKAASPAVVSIFTERPARARGGLNELFGFELPFGRNEQPPSERLPRERGAGSGFVIDKTGFILTNNHVVDGAESIEVWLPSMRQGEFGLPAKVIGRDELSDSALIQLTELPSEPLAVAKFGDSDQMAPGDWVMAIGNPFGLSNTVTVGVVSAVGRENETAVRARREEMIQTDAAINQGNSGGPLLNIRGEVIGINTMIISNGGDGLGGGGNLGVGFAVPINTVRDLLPQLRQGKVVRGRIGVELQGRPMSRDYASSLGLPNTNGAEVSNVPAGGPAANAGMRAGDVIVEYNGRPVTDNGDLVGMVTRTAPGTTVPVRVIRDRKSVSLNVTVEELDLDQERTRMEQLPGRAPSREEETSTDFGMALRDLTPNVRRQLSLPNGRNGAVVASVTPFGPAAEAGLRFGDVILSVANQPVGSVEEASKALSAIPTGQTVRIIVWQEGSEVLVRLRRR
jgi:serine protease Do